MTPVTSAFLEWLTVAILTIACAAGLIFLFSTVNQLLP